MRRKIIQVAGSTQLISLPRKWAKKYNIKKGEELEVEEQGNKIIIKTEKSFDIKKSELDINDLEPMVIRCVVALYKKGVDEIKIEFNNPGLLESLQKTMGKQAVGFEITEQGKNYCIIKNVSGELIKFDPLLRRTFLLLLSMAEQSLESVKKKEYKGLKNIAFLEEANNRFTTSCRRSLNKRGHETYSQIGPLYFIIEQLENLADQYKYLCFQIYFRKESEMKISSEIIKIYERINKLLKTFYEIFYKFDKEKLVELGKERKKLVDEILSLMETSSNKSEILILHYLLTILGQIFSLVGPYLVLNL